MPELPDVVVYVEALDRLLTGATIERVSLRSPFVMRTFDPELSDVEGKAIRGFERFGKRIAWKLDDEFYLVFHLMIAGRFHWKKPNVAARGKNDLIGFGFRHGTMMLTEASKKKLASLHVVRGVDALDEFRSRGIEPLECDLATFRERLRSENHTVKRTLTMPRLFSGIGNAYSDEILHAAKLSPLKWTMRLTDEEIERLYHSVRETLTRWTEHLRAATGETFPEKVTAFHADMAAHGRFGEPCRVCGSAIQRIRYAANETNYCPRCQNDGKMLADRSLSRLLKDDWPKTIDEWEES